MRSRSVPASNSQIQARLLLLAGAFLFLYALVLTLAPAARSRSWAVDYHWQQWIGFAAWVLVMLTAHFMVKRRIPEADPYFLPLAGLLTGWGIMTIYRLLPAFGYRQTMWLLVSGAIFLAGLYLSPELRFLRRYKYVWLTGGLLLTAMTLIFGTDPGGGSEKAWLGCCGIYLQPSEPLKLLLIVYLAAYMADRLPVSLRPLPFLFPTAVILGISLLLLVVQHDLGTVFIFIFLYTIMLFISSGKKRVLLISLAGVAIAGLAGYFLFDVVRLRVEAWLNPWLDPSGRSFQIVQSLMAVANGGAFGRGPGLGSPGLVPVAVSDFVFTAIAEETGLVGSLGLFALVGFFTARGIRAAMRAPDRFRRLLAAGLTAYIGAQSILIIGGNVRLLPLTGVTLPFVSYGGSSLLTSFVAVLILMFISSQPEEEPAALQTAQPYLILAGLIGVGLLALAVTDAWWAIWRGPDLLLRTDNARRAISDRYVRRGSLLDRNGSAIDVSQGSSGFLTRAYLYPALAPITGYINPSYGQSGLESTLDGYLRGLQGNPARTIWWDQLVYGEPPPGLDVRLSIDLGDQQEADKLLGGHSGAIVLLNAESGEILAIASHPGFDPNFLEEQAAALLKDPKSPLLDRATQDLYPLGGDMEAWLKTIGSPSANLSTDPTQLFTSLGFYTTPDLHLPAAEAITPGKTLSASPLQMALATAALSHAGIRPPARLTMAVRTPTQGWVVLPALSEPVQALPSEAAATATLALMVPGQPLWQWSGLAGKNGKLITWSLGGTLSDWRGTPLAIVVLLEETDQQLANQIGIQVLLTAMK